MLLKNTIANQTNLKRQWFTKEHFKKLINTRGKLELMCTRA